MTRRKSLRSQLYRAARDSFRHRFIPQLFASLDSVGFLTSLDQVLGHFSELDVETSDLEARRLTLEVTESLFVGDVEGRTKLLSKLRGIGVQIAIDDFGTGYSSLTSLRDMPVDILKIDKSFVDHIVSSAESARLVRMILQLAKDLGMRTVAEGVDELSQLEALREMGCQLIQGYYFSKPLPAGELQTLLQHEFTVLEGS